MVVSTICSCPCQCMPWNVYAMTQGWGHRVDCGDVDKCFESGECDNIIEGTCKMGGQEHFYLEPHGSIVIPAENDEIKIIASTQVPSCALVPFCCKRFTGTLKSKAPQCVMSLVAVTIYVCNHYSSIYLGVSHSCYKSCYCFERLPKYLAAGLHQPLTLLCETLLGAAANLQSK